MQAITQTFRYSVVHNNAKTTQWSFNKERVVNTCFNTIEFFGNCLIGLLIGGVIGWISGWCIGHTYSELYMPTHFISFEVVNKWYFMPYEYAGYGMNAGAILGTSAVLVFTIIKSIKQHQQENTEIVKS